jgi:hypothetical protein
MTDNKIGRKDGWTSVKDKMPEEGRDVLIYCFEGPWNDGGWIEIAHFKNGICQSDAKHAIIDFWQPLPEPPNTDLQNFMEQNDLGPEDMRDDNKYPTQIP